MRVFRHWLEFVHKILKAKIWFFDPFPPLITDLNGFSQAKSQTPSSATYLMDEAPQDNGEIKLRENLESSERINHLHLITGLITIFLNTIKQHFISQMNKKELLKFNGNQNKFQLTNLSTINDANFTTLNDGSISS